MKKSLKRIHDWGDYIALFVLNAAGMILELVASRLLSPYFGNSNFVWTAIIGIILLAGSLGNLIGGRIASRKYSRAVASFLLMVASLYIALIPLTNAPILADIKNSNMDVGFSSILSSIMFFLIPATLLGVITPIILKERIGDSKNEDKGKESGRITAIIAIGSLVGTFIGGFWLIPSIGTKGIFVLLGFVVLFSALFVQPFSDLERRKLKMGILLFFLLVFVVNCVSSVFVLQNNSDDISIDTEYGRIIIQDVDSRNNRVRYYKQSGSYSSATYLSDEKKYDLVFEYLKKYDEMFKYTDAQNVAMIGGAAYQYPKYFISHFEDKNMDVIEIDPKSTEIAREYFFLDDLIRDYGQERLGLYNEDGRVFLSKADKKYDVILNDAFSGEVPVATLATKEAVQIIKEALNRDGVYMSNIIGALKGEKSKFLKAEVNTMKKVFKHVYVTPVYDDPRPDKYINWMVIATDNGSYKPSDTIEIDLEHAPLLTDDYNPVEQLVSTSYHDN